MDESALHPIFEEFGVVVDLTIIRDRISNEHKGCAFVTYGSKQSADLAVCVLHEKAKLPNVCIFILNCGTNIVGFIILSTGAESLAGSIFDNTWGKSHQSFCWHAFKKCKRKHFT